MHVCMFVCLMHTKTHMQFEIMYSKVEIIEIKGKTNQRGNIQIASGKGNAIK